MCSSPRQLLQVIVNYPYSGTSPAFFLFIYFLLLHGRSPLAIGSQSLWHRTSRTRTQCAFPLGAGKSDSYVLHDSFQLLSGCHSYDKDAWNAATWRQTNNWIYYQKNTRSHWLALPDSPYRQLFSPDLYTTRISTSRSCE